MVNLTLTFIELLNQSITALIQQVVLSVVDLFICEQLELLRRDQDLRRISLRLREQGALFEVEKVEDHQHPHAHPFEQPDNLLSQVGAILHPGFPPAELVLVQGEPAHVRKCKEEGDRCIYATFPTQGALDFPKLAHLSIHCSLRFHEEPDDQGDHNNDLAQEHEGYYVVTNANIAEKGFTMVFFLLC